MSACQGLTIDQSTCTRKAKPDSHYCWQHEHSHKLDHRPSPSKTSSATSRQKGGNPEIVLSIANFNVLNHTLLNSYTKFHELGNDYTQRYLASIKILMSQVIYHQISIVSLEEVTVEYYNLFISIYQNFIQNQDIQIFYDEKSLMTLFINHPKCWIIEVVPVPVNWKLPPPTPYEEKIEGARGIDRLQIFNVTGQSGGQDFHLAYINVHGHGNPIIRENYLYETIKYIGDLRKNQSIYPDFLFCGDFNSDLVQIGKILLQVKKKVHWARPNMADVKLYQDARPTSYHRFVARAGSLQGYHIIKDENDNVISSTPQFIDQKPREHWFTKMDHLLYNSGHFRVTNLMIIPDGFTHSDQPYQMVDGRQILSNWISDHTLNIYHLQMTLGDASATASSQSVVVADSAAGAAGAPAIQTPATASAAVAPY